MKTSPILRTLTVLAATAAAASALAAVNLPKEGSYDVVACWTGTSADIAVGKDYSANSYEMVGTVVSRAPGGFGDQSTFRCVGMNTMAKGRAGGGNQCEVTDADGDKRLNAFQIQPDGKVTREMLAGTGKYEGMSITNVVALMPPMKPAKPGTFQGCNQQTGAYKLK
jgi:hypothetical protein